MEVRNAQPFHTSINGNSSKNGDPTSTFSKVIVHELSDDFSADVYFRCWVNFTHDAVLTEIPNFMNMGLSSVHTSDEPRSLSIPTTRIRRPTDRYNCLPPGHIIGEVTADRMSRTGSEQIYSSKTDFETRREHQDFERQNISMSQPPLDSTPFGKNTTNRTTSPIDSIPVRTKTLYPKPLTRPTDSPILPTDLPFNNGKLHVPGDPGPDQSLSDSSSKKI